MLPCFPLFQLIQKSTTNKYAEQESISPKLKRRKNCDATFTDVVVGGMLKCL